MRSPLSTGSLLGGIAVATLVVSGCATTSAPAPEDSGLVQIVASTNVYGDIAARIGGDLVEVTSIIVGSAQDPHSYEATAQDQLALSKASLVIENGGGYDPFIDTMLDASGDDGVVIVNASDVSGLIDGDEERADEEQADDVDSHDGETIEGFNEHVWYSFSGVENVAEQIARELGEIDEDNAALYEDNYAAFAAEIDALEERAEGIRAQTDGRNVAITEPVPLYLLEEVGLTNTTPDEFSEAVEEGTDVAPAVLQETLALFADDTTALLAYNAQTGGPITEQVRTAAEDAGVPVVSFTETLADGEDYFGWMNANLDAVADAVA